MPGVLPGQGLYLGRGNRPADAAQPSARWSSRNCRMPSIRNMARSTGLNAEPATCRACCLSTSCGRTAWLSTPFSRISQPPAARTLRDQSDCRVPERQRDDEGVTGQPRAGRSDILPSRPAARVADLRGEPDVPPARQLDDGRIEDLCHRAEGRADETRWPDHRGRGRLRVRGVHQCARPLAARRMMAGGSGPSRRARCSACAHQARSSSMILAAAWARSSADSPSGPNAAVT